MAKVFAQFDIDGSGALDLSELTKLVGSLGLSEEDAAATLNNLGGSADKKIKLEDWEHALDDRLRGLIEASLNEQGRVVGTE
jgi:Ca2+-binding EF-hand superfamily protein